MVRPADPAEASGKSTQVPSIHSLSPDISEKQLSSASSGAMKSAYIPLSLEKPRSEIEENKSELLLIMVSISSEISFKSERKPDFVYFRAFSAAELICFRLSILVSL